MRHTGEELDTAIKFSKSDFTVTNPATPDKVIEGYKFINENSEVKDGTIGLEEKIVTPSDEQIEVNPSTGKYLSKVTVNPVESEEKIVTPSIEIQDVLPSNGVYLSKVTVNPCLNGELGNLTLSNTGLLSCPVETPGYFYAGYKKTLAVPVKSTETYALSLADVVIPKGTYLSGIQTIKAVNGANLGTIAQDFKAENIKKDVTIFGVTGTAEGGGGNAFTAINIPNVSSGTVIDHILYDGRKYLVLTSNPYMILSSSDMITWAQHVDPRSEDSVGIAYGNGVYIIKTEPGAKAYVSSDLYSWTTVYLTDGNINYNRLIHFINGAFIAGGNYGWYTSTDGTVWDRLTSLGTPMSYDGRIIANSDKLSIMAGSGFPYIYVSSDGIEWEQEQIGITNNHMSTLCSDFSNFILTTYNNSKSTSNFYYSTDGTTWTNTSSIKKQISKLIYGNGTFIALPKESQNGLYSFDGLEWTEFKLPSSRWTNGVYGNGMFVINGSNKIAYCDCRARIS